MSSDAAHGHLNQGGGLQGAASGLPGLDLPSSSRAPPRVTSTPSGLCRLGLPGTLQC